MVEPLIRLLAASDEGYNVASCCFDLTTKLYVDGGTLVTNSIEDMISLVDIVQHFSTWSDIQLNVAKCKMTAYIHELQSIPQRRDRDDALRARLAHVTLAGRTSPRRIHGHVSHSLPRPGGTPPLDQVSNYAD